MLNTLEELYSADPENLTMKALIQSWQKILGISTAETGCYLKGMVGALWALMDLLPTFPKDVARVDLPYMLAGESSGGLPLIVRLIGLVENPDSPNKYMVAVMLNPALGSLSTSVPVPLTPEEVPTTPTVSDKNGVKIWSLYPRVTATCNHVMTGSPTECPECKIPVTYSIFANRGLGDKLRDYSKTVLPEN